MESQIIFLEKVIDNNPKRRFLARAKRVYFCTFYVPISGPVQIDTDNEQHQIIVNDSKIIYSSKFKDKKGDYYLFKDFKEEISLLPGFDELNYVIPVPSSHNLSYRFAKRISDEYGIPYIDMMIKQDKNDYRYRPDVEDVPRESKVLLVDDIFTSGSAFDEALRVLVEDYGLSVGNVTLFAIAHTERNPDNF